MYWHLCFSLSQWAHQHTTMVQITQGQCSEMWCCWNGISWAFSSWRAASSPSSSVPPGLHTAARWPRHSGPSSSSCTRCKASRFSCGALSPCPAPSGDLHPLQRQTENTKLVIYGGHITLIYAPNSNTPNESSKKWGKSSADGSWAELLFFSWIMAGDKPQPAKELCLQCVER